jgi:LysR family transcriptional regulator, transcriptional activator of nhaA
MNVLGRLNYQHLHYFWTVARCGSVSGASAELDLAPSTVSAQVKLLEDELGQPLLRRRGRGLVVTEVGANVFRYADDIFRIGDELVTAVQEGSAPSRAFAVGLSDVVPKLVASKLLIPIFSEMKDLRVVCQEDRPDALFGELAAHRLDVVVHDAPLPSGAGVRGFSHLLGESAVTVFASKSLAKRLASGFPRSLDGAPFLVPMPDAALRGQLKRAFADLGVRPKVRAEIHDSALLKSLAQGGVGAFAGPNVIGGEIERQYDVVALGELANVVERFYVISTERRIRHPGAAKVLDVARGGLFS